MNDKFLGVFGMEYIVNELINGTEPKNILIPFVIQVVLSALYIGLRLVYISQIIAINSNRRLLKVSKINVLSKVVMSLVPLLFTTAISSITIVCESKKMDGAWYMFMVSLIFFWIYQLLTVMSDIGFTIQILEGKKPQEFKFVDNIIAILKNSMLRRLNRTLGNEKKTDDNLNK